MTHRPRCASALAPATLLVWLAASLPLAGQVQVMSVTPTPHALAAPTATPVRVTFDQSLKPATVGPTTVRVFGRWSGPVTGTYKLSADDTVLEFQPDRPFQPGESVTVMLSDRLRSLGGDSLDGGYEFAFWTAPVAGPGQYQLAEQIELKLPGEGFIQAYGVYAADLDHDGAPDFCAPTEVGSDVRVLLNDRCGSFTGPFVTALPALTSPSSNEGQDFDRDGHVDLATGGIQSDTLVLLFGDGEGGFDRILELPAGDTPRGVAVLDGDGDGDPDIVLAHRGSSNLGLVENNGDRTFDPIVFFEGGVSAETAVVPADADNDGHADLFVAGYVSSTVALLRNVGDAQWTVADVESVGAQPWMAAAGDIDIDGFPDVATVDSNGSTASVVFNDGAGGLLPRVPLAIGNFAIAIDLGDLDGDGDLDLVASSFSSESWRLWFNDGSGQFTTFQNLPASQAASCATLVDYDRDGLLDIVGLDEMADTIRLWRHVAPQPVGVQPRSCGATLRLDNQAALGGYGGHPPAETSPGSMLYIGVSTGAPAAWVLLGGLAAEPGAAFQPGLLNLGPPLELLIAGATDGLGESVLQVPLLEATLPGPIDIGLQLYVDGTGPPVLSNPEVLRLVP